MAKMTLIEIVQDILNDMDSDEVNSINDTIEAQQVAQIVKTTFYNIVDGRHWPHLQQLIKLDSPASVSYPTRMKMPETVTKLDWVKYNKRKSTDTKDKFEDVKYLEPYDFVNYCNARDSSDTEVLSMVEAVSGVNLLIATDAAPMYYTSFDDEYIYMDAYDSAVDTTLQSSKTMCNGMVRPEFTISDSFVPDLPAHAFSYLLNEAKSTSFVALKQTQNGKAEQHSISQRRRMSQDMWKVSGGVKIPNYGRHK